MHSIWHIPELLIHIVLHLEEEDIANIYHVSHHWRQTLRNNLPPQLRPLPDATPNFERRPIPDTVRTLADEIELQQRQWTSLATLIELGDEYFFWRDGALEMVLQQIKPQLHPFLSTNAHALIGGLASVAGGKMGIWLQTQCSNTEFLKLCEDPKDEHLTQPPTSSVELYCPKGGVWNATNKSVRRREGPTWRCNFVTIERKEGVRMSDVVDELRSVLVSDEGDGCILLDWQFGKTLTLCYRVAG